VSDQLTDAEQKWIDSLCEHWIERERCVMCGPLEGNVFDARCDQCDANTWHHGDDEHACLRCGRPDGDPSTSMLNPCSAEPQL
jgi:hypothetical protein